MKTLEKISMNILGLRSIKFNNSNNVTIIVDELDRITRISNKAYILELVVTSFDNFKVQFDSFSIFSILELEKKNDANIIKISNALTYIKVTYQNFTLKEIELKHKKKWLHLDELDKKHIPIFNNKKVSYVNFIELKNSTLNKIDDDKNWVNVLDKYPLLNQMFGENIDFSQFIINEVTAEKSYLTLLFRPITENLQFPKKWIQSGVKSVKLIFKGTIDILKIYDRKESSYTNKNSVSQIDISKENGYCLDFRIGDYHLETKLISLWIEVDPVEPNN